MSQFSDSKTPNITVLARAPLDFPRTDRAAADRAITAGSLATKETPKPWKVLLDFLARTRPDKIVPLSHSDGLLCRILSIVEMHVIRSSTKVSLPNFSGFERLVLAPDARMTWEIRALPERTS
jgi:hypothetical protein